MHHVLCLVQKASLHTKEKLIQCLYPVENHLLNIPGRLKSKEKSDGFLFKQRGAKKLISAISQRHALFATRTTFAKANS